MMEPKETYLEKYVIIDQARAIISPTCQFSANIVPTPDATDFPPENLRKIDLLCPKITAIAHKTGINPMEVKLVANIFAKITGKAPLNASKSITVKNHLLPITLLTFVAPVEPEPLFLMSSPVKSFTIMYPVGIEPIRYAIIIANINSIFSPLHETFVVPPLLIIL